MSYKIYARKYRPVIFEQVIGQKPVVQTLKNAIENDRIAQAYIFSGMRGVGKTTVARILAKALNCQNGPTSKPCNKCELCKAVNEDRSLDVIEIDGAANRRVEEARTLLERIQYKPIHSRYKVIIIDEVHMLTLPAFNTLLKTLEEPPANTVFIFATTEFHKVPATIISRCQHFEFKKISHKNIIDHLVMIAKKENITISTYGLNLIAEAADGSLRDAQSLLDQAVSFSGENITDEDLKEILGTISRKILFQISSAIMDEKAERIFPLVEEITEKGCDLRFLYSELIQHFRDMLLIKSVSHPQDLLPLDEKDMKSLKEEAGKASSEEILRYLIGLQNGEQGLKFSSHPKIYLEASLVKLCHFKKITPLKEIIGKLEGVKKEINDPSEKMNNTLTSVLGQRNDIKENASFAGNYSSEKKIKEKSETSLSGNMTYQKESVKVPEENVKKEREIDVALKDPAVQNFMKTFKAQILSVEQIKKAKDKR